jgi:hypothetical protein
MKDHITIAGHDGAFAAYISMERKNQFFKRAGMVLAAIMAFSLFGSAQEVRSEVSVQGTGFFTKDSNNNGIRNQATNSGGFLVGNSARRPAFFEMRACDSACRGE